MMIKELEEILEEYSWAGPVRCRNNEFLGPYISLCYMLVCPIIHPDALTRG
jgi:hypothetical protein